MYGPFKMNPVMYREPAEQRGAQVRGIIIIIIYTQMQIHYNYEEEKERK